jgi:hypothetical protein
MGIFHYNFGFEGSLDSAARETEIKQAIRKFFKQQEGVTLLQFLGNPDRVDGDIMRCKVRTDGVNGYDLLRELTQPENDSVGDYNGVTSDLYIIQGSRDSH